LIAKTKQAAIAALMSSGIQADERWWDEAEFSILRRQSGRLEQTKLIVRAIPNATLKELFVQMDSDMGCEVTCDVRTIKEYQLENCGIFEPPPFRLSRIVRDEWTAWHKLWRNLGATENQIQCPILLDVEARIHEEAEEIKYGHHATQGLYKQYGYKTTSNLWDRYGFTIQNQLQRFSVALTELRGRGREYGQFKAMRPLKMLKDMVHGTAHRYHKP